LSPQQKTILMRSLELPMQSSNLTREILLTEWESLRKSGAFSRVSSLRDAYSRAAHANLSDEQLAADIRASATAWEHEIVEF
jgi:hypothetical protein